MKYDVIILGSGPGGYVAAIRASQLGLKTAVVEKENIGGICLNWGCIPTKALLKSAQVFEYLNHAEDYGLNAKGVTFDFNSIVKRSRKVADKMSKGVSFLLKKNKVDVIMGKGKLTSAKKVEVANSKKETKLYQADHIILATGARSRQLPTIPQDGKYVIGYREAMTLSTLPKKMIVVGSGAIGSEFAYFYNALGTEITLVEYLPRIVPVEDEEISKQLEQSFKKQGIKVKTNSSVESVSLYGDLVVAIVKSKKEEKKIVADVVLSAVGIEPNLEDIGLEELGIKTENNKVVVDQYYKTSVDGVYAIGDITAGPALAHVASAEGILCVEKIAGMDVESLDYGNLPGCTYCHPEIASVGLTEQQAKEQGFDIKVGKFPFSASGKATANGNTEGFVKVIFDTKYGEWLGCHMIGNGVTDMIAEAVACRKLETTGHEIIKSVHPHPTLSEAVMEATADAYGEVIHIYTPSSMKPQGS